MRHSLERAYPVLWVLDAPLIMRSVVGLLDVLVLGNLAPEMIVIGVGSPPEEGLAGVGRRDGFLATGKGYAPPGLAGERWSALAPIPDFPQKTDAFLSLLVDEIRPKLAAEYRFSGEHALFGHSAGGMFAAYSLFTRPRCVPEDDHRQPVSGRSRRRGIRSRGQVRGRGTSDL